MFVNEKYKIAKDVRDAIELKSYKFGYTGFGEIVYNTNYSRRTVSGGQERWIDTVVRVVEGVMSIRKDWYKKHSLKWDSQYWDKIASSMLYYMYTLKILPPGRGLWINGTDYVYERGGMALNNCGVSVIKTLTFAEDVGWLVDALMCGTGVGLKIDIKDSDFRYAIKNSLEYITWVENSSTSSGRKNVVIIDDTREGWVDSVITLLNSYRRGKSKAVVEFDYSKIRLKGVKLKGFGGTSSGAAPLIELHGRISQYMCDFIMKRIDTTRLFADIVNAVGCCVVAGGVRRSAELILGSLDDDTFLKLKNYKVNPDRSEIGWMSNNTVGLSKSQDFLKLDRVLDSVCENGEPGLLNLINVKKYERFGVIGVQDTGEVCNPCILGSTTVLVKDKGTCKIENLKVGDYIWSKESWTKVLNKFNNGIKEVYKYTTNSGVIYLTKDHKIIQNGKKIRVNEASYIDNLSCTSVSEVQINCNDIMDGLVIGDGACLRQGKSNYLYIGGKDQDYFDSEVKHLIKNCVRPTRGLYRVISSIIRKELPVTYKRSIPERFIYSDKNKIVGFLRGLFSANGNVAYIPNKLYRVSLRATSRKVLEQVQVMLSSLGIKSYVTTDKLRQVNLDTRRYISKESYKVNITNLDILIFKNFIGFIQSYKNKILDEMVANRKIWGRRTIVSKIKTVSFYKREEVYDITVDNKSHTFWADTFNISNCGELCIEDKEFCNLVEIFPSKARNKKEFLHMCELAAIYATSVSLLPTHNKESNAVIARNRRIGVSLSGVADWIHKWGAFKAVRFMRDGYNCVKECAKYLNAQAGVPAPIRITTIKPSGTVSLLAGVSPGMHFPIHEYAIRRMRISSTSSVLELCRRAGLPIEADVNNLETTSILEYPIYTGGTRSVSEVSAWEQFSLLALLQREWSDNLVSCTVTFNQKEKKDIGRMLAYFLPLIKGVSLLPNSDDVKVYPQMPYERINKEEYNKRCEKIKKIDWSTFSNSDGIDQKFCTNDSCTI